MNRLQQISRWALLLYIMLSMSWLGAQNAAQIDVLTTDDGLLFRDVSNIAQDSKGLMWFGTTQGLNRYDGYNFKAYTSDTKNPFYIKEDYIKTNMVYEPTENALWFTANDEMFQLRLTEDSIINHTIRQHQKNRIVDVFKTKDNAIWIVTDDYLEVKKDSTKLYLQKFENNAFQAKAMVTMYKYPFCQVALDADGFIHLTTTGGTNKYNLNGELVGHTKLALDDWYANPFHYVPSFFDSKNTHYCFPLSGGITIFDATTHSHKTILKTNEVISNAIEDHNENIWFYSDSDLYKMDSKGNFTDYTKILKETFDFSLINTLYVDQAGLLWGSTDNGLFKIQNRNTQFTNLFKSNKEGWGNSMRGILEAFDGRVFFLSQNRPELWYVTKTGAIDTLQLTDTSGKPSWLYYDANFIVTDKTKTIAYTTGRGLSEINLKTGLTKTYDFLTHINDNGPNGILRLDDGKLLFGYTLEYLTIFDPESKKSNPVFSPNTLDSNIRDIRVIAKSRDQDQVWLGTHNDGVIKIDLKGEIIASYNQNTIPKFGNYQVLSLLEVDDGSLWVGTYGGGLKHITADGKTITTYTKAEGLADNNVVGILKEGNDKFWISTYNGLSLFNKNTKEFQNFYTEDGLSHNEFNSSSFFKDGKGLYYFGGMNGVNVFNPKALQKSVRPPDMQFLGISRYNSKKRESYNTDYTQKEFTSLEVSPYDQYFEINWTMPSYFQNNKNTYSTKLEGFEDRWFYQGNVSSIRYNKLPAGDYVLKVKGKDARGNESASILSIPITVKQIFYKRWWFIALVLLAITAVIYAIFKYRLQQVLAMDRLRTKIASDLHDDVGSMLSGLAMQTELLEANANAADKSKFQKIANISRNAISQMRDLVWSIDSRRQTTNDLMERLQELAEELLLPKDIVFKIENEAIKFPNKKLAPQTKQNIFLIVKEAFTNVVRHSNATEVSIAIKQQAQGSCIIIHDNGTTKATPSTGLGLSNINMRAEQIKGRLTITNGSGFCITLQLPFYL